MSDIMKYFPLETPRKSQVAVIAAIEKAFSEGKRYVILEAPVGSGKSAIAMTFAQAFGPAHVLTPRKSLQNQYFEDFSDLTVLMKGRSAYPCTYDSDDTRHKKIIKLVKTGMVPSPEPGEPSCAGAPCKDSKVVWEACQVHMGRECPYQTAVLTAQECDAITHNLHSFIFQTNYAGWFEKRPIMIIDEAHEVSGIVRDFTKTKISISGLVPDSDYDLNWSTDDWCDFFMRGENRRNLNAEDDEKYCLKVASFRATKDWLTSYSVSAEQNYVFKYTAFEFTPETIGNTAHRLIFNYGDKVLLMSGTIYSKDMFCREVGIPSDEAAFIKIGSEFPVRNRPIYCKPEYRVDTSFKNWEAAKPEMKEKLEKIFSVFHDVKGLVHTPSYKASEEIATLLKNKRVITHGPHDFQDKLEMFFASDGNSVFLSPVCQQGVDFKQDRARFQVILRVPYLNTSDPFVEYKVARDFPWYNYQSLITFGQQIGRVNRAPDDFGVTILMDERFVSYIRKNSSVIPKWVKDAVIY